MDDLYNYLDSDFDPDYMSETQPEQNPAPPDTSAAGPAGNAAAAGTSDAEAPAADASPSADPIGQRPVKSGKIKPLNAYEVSTLCEQLAILFHTGITPRESMEILIRDSHKKEEAALFQQMLDALNSGAPLHTAMEQTGVFPPYVVRLCAVGTETGKLDIVMQSLADYYEEEYNLRENLKSAVSYPLVMVAMMAVVIIVLFNLLYHFADKMIEKHKRESSPKTTA